jgi:ribosomal-protein-alanine N-acetyltransferase
LDNASQDNQNAPIYVLRPMRTTDLEQVIGIEHQSFSTPWSPLTYLYEINQNRNAYMGVVECQGDSSLSHEVPSSRLQILMRPFKRRTVTSTIVAFGGVWVRGTEAHISTIASHPSYRGQNLGELMLVGLVMKGVAQRADHTILEVRVSNHVAQRLYTKYGFEKSNVIARYYHDNDEDAYLMTSYTADEDYRVQLKANLTALCSKVVFRDEFTNLQLDRRFSVPQTTSVEQDE